MLVGSTSHRIRHPAICKTPAASVRTVQGFPSASDEGKGLLAQVESFLEWPFKIQSLPRIRDR